jgi:hypothetical protein
MALIFSLVRGQPDDCTGIDMQDTKGTSIYVIITITITTTTTTIIKPLSCLYAVWSHFSFPVSFESCFSQFAVHSLYSIVSI